jgi:phosphatidate cytidylyltransferase
MMTPNAAWHSDVFWLYLLIVAGVLAGAGMVLAFITVVLKKDVRPAWVTYRSWLVMAPLVLGSIFAGRATFIVLIGFLAVFGMKEFAKATGLYHDWWITGGAYVGIIAIGLSSLLPHPRGVEGGPGWYGLFMTLPVYAICLILSIPIWLNRVRGQLQRTSLATVGFIYVGWMFGHLGFLANTPHAYGYLLYLIFATELNDVAAFTCGRLFGRHPFRSEISPKKTWEGAVGALLVSLALPWVLQFSFPHFTAAQLVLTGLIVGIGGQLGDLSISVIKRDIGIKDMGAMIPGHGGILDRIDSLIYVAPLFLHLVNYCHGLR